MIQISVSEIQKMIEAQVANPEFASALLSSLKLQKLSTLKDAGPNDIAFFFSKHYELELMATKAGVVIIANADAKSIEAAGVPAWKKSVFISCARPNLALAKLTSHFSPHFSSHDHQQPSATGRIHPSAVIGSNVKLGKGVEVGAYTIIEDGCELHDGAVIYPQCFIGKNSIIGKGSVLFPRVTLYEKTSIGARCRIHSGVVIGGDGFGYIQIKDQTTQKPIDHLKIYHVGNVLVGDDVEIGANATIDRGTMGSTVIHSKVKIDNLVQVGHNCEVGEGSILCGAAGMAGSSSLGKFVTVAAQAGTGNQVHVGDYSVLGAFSGVAKDCPPDSELAGMPARPISEYYKILAIQNKLLRERGKDRKKS
jgi:UDP-3-O-[3-hydroxymyristoyl] glucosamine N-acyltransferase